MAWPRARRRRRRAETVRSETTAVAPEAGARARRHAAPTATNLPIASNPVRDASSFCALSATVDTRARWRLRRFDTHCLPSNATTVARNAPTAHLVPCSARNPIQHRTLACIAPTRSNDAPIVCDRVAEARGDAAESVLAPPGFHLWPRFRRTVIALSDSSCSLLGHGVIRG